MDDERLAGKLLCAYASKIGQPVMGMYDIYLVPVLEGYRSAHHRITCHFLHKVRAVFAGKLVFLAVLDTEVLNLTASLLLDHRGEILRVDIRNHIRPDMHELHLSEELVHRSAHRIHWHIAGIDNPYRTLILVSGCRRHHEKHLYTIGSQSFGHSVTGCSESARNMGRKLPSEHQHFHLLSSLYLSIR